MKIVDDLKSHYEETEVKELLEILTYHEPNFKMDYCMDTISQKNLTDLVRMKIEEDESQETKSSIELSISKRSQCRMILYKNLHPKRKSS